MQIVVGDVHATYVGRLSVYSNNFAVVAMIGSVDLGKDKGSKLVHHDTLGTQTLHVLLCKVFRAPMVALSVNQNLHLHTFLRFLPQKVQRGIAYAVIVEFVKFNVDITFCTTDMMKEVIEKRLSTGQEMHLITLKERHIKPPQSIHSKRVALFLGICGENEGKSQQARQQACGKESVSLQEGKR